MLLLYQIRFYFSERIFQKEYKAKHGHADFIYSPLAKALEKQIKRIEDQGKKQIKSPEEHGKLLVKSNSEKDSLTF